METKDTTYVDKNSDIIIDGINQTALVINALITLAERTMKNHKSLQIKCGEYEVNITKKK